MKRQTLLIGLAALLFIFAACNSPEPPPEETEPTIVPEVVVPEPTAEPEVLPTVPSPTPEQLPEPTAVPETETDPGDGGQAGGNEGGGTGGESQAISTQHTVKEREWLVQIARCYGTSPQDILNANSVPHPGWIMAGETWTIPNVGSVSTAVGEPCIFTYTIQQGDTLYSIAQRFKIPLDMLVFANYGCYGYSAHYDWYYYPPVPEPYGGATHLPYYPAYGGCYYTSYPYIYPGDKLIIPSTPDNADMRPQ
ncbi:MAG: LysM peptidoglycan-binding domain-containing protein [Chloroflexi bacterium]|nr:LysM peptidoglycan-binding domain-containing protein [Chloroflexota bacterium]